MQANCAICHDILDATVDVCTTNCGHVFHHHCIRQWLSRSLTCPECRNRVSESNLTPIFFRNLSTWRDIVPSFGLLKKQIREKKKEITQKGRRIRALLTRFRKAGLRVENLDQKHRMMKQEILTISRQLESFTGITLRNQYLLDVNNRLGKQRSHLYDVKKILEGTVDDTKDVLAHSQWKHLGKKATKKLSACCLEAKMELTGTEEENNRLRSELVQLESVTEKPQSAPFRNLRPRNKK